MKKLVNLVDEGNELIPRVFPMIDTNNMIANFATTYYEVPQDCFAHITYGNYVSVYINGKTIVNVSSGTPDIQGPWDILLHEGDVITLFRDGDRGNIFIRAFGIRYN